MNEYPNEIFSKAGRIIVREFDKSGIKRFDDWEIDKVLLDESIKCTTPIEVGQLSVIKCSAEKKR